MKCKANARVEPLERRRLLAVVINEILAANVSGMTDADGDRSDWIELHNTGTSSFDLAGWHLTDDLGAPTKWQFPVTTLPAGGYLTVFASDKNRAVAGQELHTNFKLTSAGENLALVMSDGVTIADSYTPFPAQLDDRSFGRAASRSSTSPQTLVGATSPLRVISPTAQNASVDDFWRTVGFNDSGWISGVRSVGFDRDGSATLTPYVGTTLSEAQMPSTTSPRFTAYVRYTFDVSDPAQLVALNLQLRYDDGFIAYLNGKEVKRSGFQEDDARPNPQWDSRANQTRDDAAATAPVNFDLSPYLPLLVNGPNVLAFHAVNSASTASSSANVKDFLLEPVLTAHRANGPLAAQFMATPTPGAANGAGTAGFVADTNFSVDRGFFDAPFQVAIASATPGAQIRYTLDGSLPGESVGTLYTGPISIDETSILRAVAFKPDHTASNVDTQTYLFLDDVIQQSAADITQPFTTWGHAGPDWDMDPDIVTDPLYAGSIKNDLKAIPTMSLVMDWADLFDGSLLPGTNHTRGIYINGKSDERYAHVEYFTAGGADPWHAETAVEMQGHSSTTRWNADKMSFELKFKFPYGPTKLEHPVFAGSPDGATAANQFDNLILDAMYNYSWIHANHRQNAVARFISDQVVADFQNLAGGRAPHGKFVHLYLNGLYWGLYLVHEKPNDGFADEYYGGNKDDYDVIKHNPSPDYTFADGGVTALNNYTAFINATRQNMTNAASYAAVEALLDVDDFIDYMIVHFYAGNNDWAHNNWYATRNRVVPGARWHFHEWDQEHAFPTSDNAYLGDTIGADYDATDKDDPFAPTEIHQNLIANPEYRLKFADRAQRLLYNGGVLTPVSAAAAFQARVAEIDRAIVAESARWGDNRLPISVAGSFPYNRTAPYSRADWVATMNGIIADFFPVRTAAVLQQFTARGWLAALAAPLMSQFGGVVNPGFQLALTKPAGSPASAGIYYTLDGSDPRLPGGALSTSAILYTGPITLTSAAQVKTRVRDGSNWSAIVDATFTLPDVFPLRITEIHYHPADHPLVVDDEDLEFIELLNTGGAAISLDNVKIVEFISTPGYAFASGLTLAPGERIVVARDPAVFQSIYGTSIRLAPGGYDPGNLGNGGERVRLVGPAGETIQDFTYDDTAPWPVSPDGSGPSLEIIDPLGDAADPANWQASTVNGGTPGSGPAAAAPTVESAGFDFETGHRLRFAFSDDVGPSLDPIDVQVAPIGGGAVVMPDSVTWNAMTRSATFLFSQLLPDANYRATLAAGSVTNAGTPLASDYSFDFFVFAGDANRDRSVDIGDFSVLASRFNLPGTFSQGDFNYSGTTEIGDFAILASKFNTTLPAARVPAPAAGRARQSVPFAIDRLADELLEIRHRPSTDGGARVY